MAKQTREAQDKLIRQLVYELPVLRARLGASQAELAEKIGLSRQTYNNIENGKKEMTWTVFLAMMEFFRCNEKTRVMLEHMDSINPQLESLLQLADSRESHLVM